MIERLQKEVPFLDQVDLFAGTSTGGIISLGLAHGLPPAELVALYRDRGPEIFMAVGSRHPSRSRFLEFLSGLDAKVRELMRDLHFDPLDLLHPRYANAGLRTVLSQYFGQATLGDLKRSALVTTLRLFSEAGSWMPLVLHNLDDQGAGSADNRMQDRPTRSTRLVDAALCTSAAPSYFPPYPHPEFGFCVTAASSPTAPRASRWDWPAGPTGGTSGASASSRSARASRSAGSTSRIRCPSSWAAEYGALAWLSPLPRGASLGNRETLTPAFPLISALLDASSASNNYVCDQALAGNYHRVQMNLPKPIALDDASRETLDFLEQVADRIPKAEWRATTDWLRAQLG